MKIGKAMIYLGALTASLAISGCSDTTTTQQKITVCQEVEDGRNIRVMTVTSDKYYWDSKEKEVRAKVDEIVNQGEYNVVSVKTSYSNEYLTSAEIKYSVAEDCDNRKLEVLFVHSGKYYWDSKQKEVKPKLDKIVNSGKYNIKDVNTIMLKGYLVAAEIYYHKDK